MSTVDSLPTAGRNRPPRHRRGRGGGYRGGATQTPTATPNANPQAPDPAMSSTPASVAPETASANINTNLNRSNRGRRGGGLGRGSRRGGAQHMVNGQRAFGGQLTSNGPANSTEGSLAGDAPEFVPGQSVTSRTRPAQAPRPQRIPVRRMSKSQAPDIATRTHEDITNGQYECVICTNEVLPNSKIWNCTTCWSVLHLSCVKRWSKNEVSTHQQRASDNGELPPPRQWRCPGCNLPKTDLPNSYTCWCEKEIEPRSIGGLPPHSCGQTCSKPRVGHCPHPCELLCHAGPCPPCSHMGPSTPCFCGKEATTRRCLDTNYDSGWSCAHVCGDILPCGEHTCQRGCHEGLCGSCDVLIDSRCYCGKVQRPIPCSEREDERQSQLEKEDWMGSFNCGTECQRRYDCGNPDHFCKSTCHVQDPETAHCPFSPDNVTHCPCGKTPLSLLLLEPRKDCSAPIPHCQEKCQKELPCGHPCQELCHDGKCKPCLQDTEISCRCGRTTSKTVCHQGFEAPPSCMRICRSTLNCGRHECGERCCPGEKKASERQAAKRKHRALNAHIDDSFEPEHICLKACGRPLKCGNHSCAQLCHKGPCLSCLEAVFDEISCACGKTVLHPPQPCGMKPPVCPFECTRERTCGHSQVKHQCHEDTESCPKCPFLVEKPCICGKKTLKNQPCWFTEVRCGLPCGKKLKCGIHFCQKLCHRAGQCEDATSPCTQPCGRVKKICEHACSDPCHAPYPCKEVASCQALTFITCPCQHQKQAVKCQASKNSEGNLKKVLDCSEECLRLQRNAKLAAALNIDPATHLDNHIPYSQQTLDLYLESPKFCQQYEREFRVFAADEKEKRLRFKPMQNQQRAFLHSLAEDFGLDSESQDPEPHRHVSVFKTPRFVSAPMKTLGQCVKLRVAPSVVEPTASSGKGLVKDADPYNAFLLTNPRFGLTIDELRVDVHPEFASAGFNELDISFLPSGDIILKPVPAHFIASQKLEMSLVAMKVVVSKQITTMGLTKASTLCSVDGSLNVLRREDDNAAAGGWNQVAKGVGRRIAPIVAGVGVKSSFTVLGNKETKKAKKENVTEEAVDDWEKEVEAWDQ